MVFRKKPAPPKVKSATLSAQAEIPALREESQMSKWISVKIAKPPCPRGEARGTPVLIWPTSQTDGFGYYGRCATGKPAFYIYGAEIENVTHWQAMPEGPKAMTADMKAAMELARDPMRISSAYFMNLKAAFLEVTAALEAERKAREEAEERTEQGTKDYSKLVDRLHVQRERAAELQRRLEEVEAAIMTFLETEYPMTRRPLQAAIRNVIRALSAQPTAAGQEAAYSSGEDAVTSGQPAPSAAPIPHSKSQYRRMTAQGADVAPPLELFGLAVLRESRAELGDIDGGWIQDKAEEYGLLVRHRVTEPCGEQCRCEDFPGDCLRYSEATEAAIQPVVPVDWPFKVLEP